MHGTGEQRVESLSGDLCLSAQCCFDVFERQLDLSIRDCFVYRCIAKTDTIPDVVCLAAAPDSLDSVGPFLSTLYTVAPLRPEYLSEVVYLGLQIG